MSVYNGSHVRALGDRLLPTFYLAIRDPSCIKVKTVDQSVREDGVRYVSLIFGRDRMVASTDAAAAIRNDGQTDAAFIVTVSLPIAREETFRREVLPSKVEEWTEMFDRLCNLGHRRG